jgi:RNA polymerase sigma-70 factor (ECF subfamily)
MLASARMTAGPLDSRRGEQAHGSRGSEVCASETHRDAEADVHQIGHLEAHRAALTGHCYRMLGSVVDADDAVQDTMMRAWKGLERFDGRSSLRTWLYRIATNVCLDSLEARSRRRQLERGRPTDLWPVGGVDDALVAQPRECWIEPIADAHAIPVDVDPAARAMLRQSIRLAFVAALQHLPPRQRAALLLTEVLGWSAAEVADSLAMSVAAVNSALQRARATLAARQVELGASTGLLDPARDVLPPPQLLDRYVAAFERYDVDALVALLHHDASMAMPPYTLWLRGRAAIRDWFLGRGGCCRGSRFVPAPACGCPAFGQYHLAEDGKHRPWSVLVLEGGGEQLTSMTFFLDTETLFPRFGLPAELPPPAP